MKQLSLFRPDTALGTCLTFNKLVLLPVAEIIEYASLPQYVSPQVEINFLVAMVGIEPRNPRPKIFNLNIVLSNSKHFIFYESCPNSASFYPNRPDFSRKHPGWAWLKFYPPMLGPGTTAIYVSIFSRIGSQVCSAIKDGHTNTVDLF